MLKLKNHLYQFDDIELTESIGQNQADKNITIFLKNDVDIHKMKATIDSSLWWYFE